MENEADYLKITETSFGIKKQNEKCFNESEGEVEKSRSWNTASTLLSYESETVRGNVHKYFFSFLCLD